MADLVTSSFGENEGKQFQELWSKRITQVLEYTGATKSGSADNLQKVKDELTKSSQEIAQYFVDIKSSLDQARTEELLKINAEQMMSVVDGHAAKDYAKSLTAELQANAQIGEWADMFATSVVEQIPDRF